MTFFNVLLSPFLMAGAPGYAAALRLLPLFVSFCCAAVLSYSLAVSIQ
jgi:hypothetical protein